MLHSHTHHRGRVSPTAIAALIFLFGIAAAAVLFGYGYVSTGSGGGGTATGGQTGGEGTTEEVNQPTRSRPEATLSVTSKPTGAYVFIQAKASPPRYVGKTPLEVTHAVGSHTVHVMHRGLHVERPVQLVKDRPSSVDLTIDTDDGGMVFMPAGTFLRGSNEKGEVYERPAKMIFLDAFYIDRTEVSNLHYSLFLAYVVARPDEAYKLKHPDETSNGERRPGHREVLAADRTGGFNEPNQPIVGVDWWDAYHYAAWCGKRLPTEAEWEKAAGWDPVKRKKYDYPWGNRFSEDKGHLEHSKGRTAPVDAYPDGASPIGALNMAGNVAEWCMDWFDRYYYRTAPTKNPPGPDYISEDEAAKKRLRHAVNTKVARGGSGNYFQRFKPTDHRHTTYSRNSFNPDFRHQVIGFRCARPATKEEIEREMAKRNK